MMLHWTEFNEATKFDLDKADRKKAYCNNIFVLDIETTSLFADEKHNTFSFDKSKDKEYYSNFERIGICYIWQLSIDDVVYYGRYLRELREFIFILNDKLKERKGIIWVHNLAFEFQFLLNVFEFNNVFAREQRKPIKCEIADTDFELRCSLMLASMKLENIPKQYNLKINKKTGQLDYDKIRHNKTSLTDDEMEYCEYDCLVVYEYIKLMIKEYGHLKDIPLTSTGKIRDKFKKYLQEKDGSKFGVRNWKRYVSKLTPNAETFIDLVKCFAGGYTHANAYFSNKLLTDVKSVDFTSSYPYVMLSEKFPSGIFVKENNFNIEDIDYNRAYILKLKFKNIRSICAMNYISLYKAGSSVVNVNVDNGRIYSADELTITITEQDYYIISNTYEFESVEVLDTKTGFLNAPNLKCVEISPNIYKIYYSYFGNCINLKKIISIFLKI